MKVSVLNRVFLIAGLWDLTSTSRHRVAGCECIDCLGDECGPECSSRLADEAWMRELDLRLARIDKLASPLGGLGSVLKDYLGAAYTLAKQDSREGRRAARIMRKSYARAARRAS